MPSLVLVLCSRVEGMQIPDVILEERPALSANLRGIFGVPKTESLTASPSPCPAPFLLDKAQSTCAKQTLKETSTGRKRGTEREKKRERGRGRGRGGERAERLILPAGALKAARFTVTWRTSSNSPGGCGAQTDGPFNSPPPLAKVTTSGTTQDPIACPFKEASSRPPRLARPASP